MYEFSPISPRVARIRHRYRETKPKVCMERFRLVTEFYKAHPAMPPMIKRAKNLLNICENIPFLVNEDEVIVGELGSSYRCSALYPEYAIGWMFDEIRSGEFFTRPLDPYDIDPEDVEYFMKQEDFWRNNDLSRLTTEALPPEFSDIVGNGVVTFRDKEVAGGPVGHFCANYDKAIRKGFGAIKAEAQAKTRRHQGPALRQRRREGAVLPRGHHLLRRHDRPCEALRGRMPPPGRGMHRRRPQGRVDRDGRGPRLDHAEPGPHLPRSRAGHVPLPDRPLPRRQPARPQLRPGRPVPGQLLRGRPRGRAHHP